MNINDFFGENGPDIFGTKKPSAIEETIALGKELSRKCEAYLTKWGTT